MILNLYNLLNATSNSHRFGAAAALADQSRIAMAGQMQPNMGPAALQNTFNLDRALELQSVQSKVMFAANQAMRESATKALKADLDQQKRLNQIWYS